MRHSYLQRLNGVNQHANQANNWSNVNGNNGNLQGAQVSSQTQPQLDPLDRKIVIQAANATDAAATAVIFGYARHGAGSTNAGSGTGITVSSTGSASHEEIKRMMAIQPFEVVGLKMRTTSTAQFSNVCTYSYRSYSGTLDEKEFVPDDSVTQFDNNTNIVEIEVVKGTLFDAATRISVSVNSGVTLTFIFTIRAKFDPSRALRDNFVVQASPYGIPNPAQKMIVSQQ